MKISRLKFVILFLLFAIAFMLGTTFLLDQPMTSLLNSRSEATWKSIVAAMLSPIKIILAGPLVPFIQFLHQDPDTPPPFFLSGFVFYWTVLALLVHYLKDKINHVT